MSAVSPLPVEEQIPIAEAIVREELDHAGLVYEISVEPWFDPEYPREGEQMLTVTLRSELPTRVWLDINHRVRERLDARGIDTFEGLLGFDLIPAW